MDNRKYILPSIGWRFATDMILKGSPEWVQAALASAKQAAHEATKDGFPDFSFTFACKSQRHADAIQWWLNSHDIEVIIITPRQRVDENLKGDTLYHCSARLPVARKEWHDGE